MADILSIDVETRSTVDLKSSGTHAYAEHPSTSVLMAAYAFDDEPVQLWLASDPFPRSVIAHVAAGGKVSAFNAAFELTIWAQTLMRQVAGLPPLTVEQTDCVMVRAMALALPASLEMLAHVLDLPIKKDKAGHRVMMQLCKPRSYKAGSEPVWWNDEEKTRIVGSYCMDDVAVERAARKRLYALPDRERKLWILDQKINARGVAIDLESVQAAEKIVIECKADYNYELKTITGGFIDTAGQTKAALQWLELNGAQMDNLQRQTVADAMEGELPTPARRVLEIRKATSLTSTTKLKAMRRAVSRDGRARGLLQFRATYTGRWGGRRLQPQNMPRPMLDGRELEQRDIDTAFQMLRNPCGRDMLALYYGQPIEVISGMLRGMIVAAPGKRFIAADWSNIEGRIAAWYGNEQWKLQAFRDYDAGTGPDLYKVTYSKMFNIKPEDVTKVMRQQGKCGELSLQYQGGLGAFTSMGAVYGLHVLPDDQKTEIRPPNTLYESEVQAIKKAWRAANPGIEAAWHSLEQSAMEAIRSGRRVDCLDGRVAFAMKGPFLFMRLPSGGIISYVHPKVIKGRVMFDADGKVTQDVADCVTSRTVDKIQHWGVSSVTRKWEAQIAYGGSLFANVVSGSAREVLAETLLRLEDAGYNTVLHVHDDVLTEMEHGRGSLKELYSLMTVLPDWMPGLPMAVDGWEGQRLQK